MCRTEIVDSDGRVHKVPAKIVQPIHEGQTLQYWSTGGGGYGPPTERVPELVVEDVLDGRVSVEAAEQVYGVVIKEGELDAVATRKKRKEAA